MKGEQNNKILPTVFKLQLFDHILKHFKDQCDLKIISTPNQIELE